MAAMHGDRLSYAESFQEALRGLLGERVQIAAQGAPGQPPGSEHQVRKALEAFEAYFRLLGEQRFGDAAAQIEALRSSLQQLAGRPKNPDCQGEPRAANNTFLRFGAEFLCRRSQFRNWSSR